MQLVLHLMRPHNQGKNMNMDIALTCWVLLTSIIGSWMIGSWFAKLLGRVLDEIKPEGDVSPFYLDE